MLEMMLFEIYGIPKEQNNCWYDAMIGFWDFPANWESEDGSLTPTASLIRVFSEELFGTKFTKTFDFGNPGNKLWLGALFSGPSKSLGVFQSAGSTNGVVSIQVQGSISSIEVVSPFGVIASVPVTGGTFQLTIPELPIFVRIPNGVQINVVRLDWGPNLALQAGVIASASGSANHPGGNDIPNDISKIRNGFFENWYYNQSKEGHPWSSNTPQFPATVTLEFPSPVPIGRVVVYCPAPWQWDGSLLNYDLQYLDGNDWKTIEHIEENPVTFNQSSPLEMCSCQSFYSERSHFIHQFPTVTTKKIQLLVHDTTWGGGATHDVVIAGGQTGFHQINIRELEVYGPPSKNDGLQ